jgi:hypothetical protein
MLLIGFDPSPDAFEQLAGMQGIVQGVGWV